MTSPNSFHFHSSTSLSHVDTGVVMTGGSISLILSTTLLKPLSISSSVNSYSLHWLIPPFSVPDRYHCICQEYQKALKSCSHIENYAVIVHFLAKHLKQIVAYYRIYFTQTLCIFNRIYIIQFMLSSNTAVYPVGQYRPDSAITNSSSRLCSTLCSSIRDNPLFS